MSAATTISMIVTFLFLFLTKAACNLPAGDFVFNGYLNLEGTASLDSQGLFTLTNGSSYSSGYAFYSFPLQFKNSTNGSVVSFSTTFIFAIRPLENGLVSGDGFSFVIYPDKKRIQYSSLPGQYLGLFNTTNYGDSANHIVAVEFDTLRNPELYDMNNNHVGIDINSLNSVKADSAGYYMTDEHGSHVFKNLSLTSGNPMQVWVEYNGDDNQLNVTIFPINMPKPEKPLLSLSLDLSLYLLQQMYVGFTAATGRLNAYHYILGWSFKLNGRAEDIDLASLPKLPMRNKNGARSLSHKVVTLLLPIVGSCLLLLAMISLAIFVWRRRIRRFVEVVEDWEVQYGPLRFSYQDLCVATKCFKENQFLGRGGFGQVYHGVLPKTNMQIAVKRIKNDSKQGMKEFVAEIATIGHLRHPKLVRLLGYCKKNNDLFLVYDFMPNGSLDQFLHNKKHALPKRPLSWPLRLKIIKDVASGLLYLHEKCTQVVIHRDIKASNILIDSEFNAKLGDFGLAKLYDHGTNALTTHVAGTLGYIAPELTRTGKPDTRTDIFAFGAFLLEVVCGRRPLEPGASPGQTLLVDWVLLCLEKGTILEVVDQNLGSKYEIEEVELVLRLGLLCSHAHAAARPNMSNVVKYLGGEVKLPENLIEVLKSQDFVHVSCEVYDNINSDSVPYITNSEPFIYVGR